MRVARIGDYILDEELGGGGAELEYLAHHAVLPRRAIVRVVAPGGTRADATRMLREAWVTEALQHPGMPRLYECGVLAGGRPWLALEVVDGERLADALATGPIAESEVIAVVRGLAEILAQAHARGIVHGAIRPEVIALGDGERRVRLTGWRDARVSCTDAAADVLALGLAAHLALTGRLPAERPHGPPRLVALIEAMLSPDPARRPSAATVAAEAALLADPRALAEDDGEPPVVEDVVLADSIVIADRPRAEEPPQPPRLRWTPPHGYQRLPSQPGAPVAIARIHTRRS